MPTPFPLYAGWKLRKATADEPGIGQRVRTPSWKTSIASPLPFSTEELFLQATGLIVKNGRKSRSVDDVYGGLRTQSQRNAIDALVAEENRKLQPLHPGLEWKLAGLRPRKRHLTYYATDTAYIVVILKTEVIQWPRGPGASLPRPPPFPEPAAGPMPGGGGGGPPQGPLQGPMPFPAPGAPQANPPPLGADFIGQLRPGHTGRRPGAAAAAPLHQHFPFPAFRDAGKGKAAARPSLASSSTSDDSSELHYSRSRRRRRSRREPETDEKRRAASATLREFERSQRTQGIPLDLDPDEDGDDFAENLLEEWTQTVDLAPRRAQTWAGVQRSPPLT